MFNSGFSSTISGWFSGSTEKKSAEESATDKVDENTESKSSSGGEIGDDNNQDVKEKENTENEKGKDPEIESSSNQLTAEEMQAKISQETQKMMNSAVTFGNYLFGVASEASKKVSEKVTETATTIKKTVEEKSIIGDLNREQEEFLQKKRERQAGDASVPPWIGYQESETMKQQILALSTDKRNFLRNPPAGVQFNFDFDHHFPVAMATLKEDENLQKMRFDLVPKSLKEEVFWRNYFYRVSLIKQSAQLSTLAEITRSSNDASSSASSTSSAVIIGSTNTGTTLSRSSSSKSLTKSDSESPSNVTNKHQKAESLDHINDTHEMEPGVGPEFVSDDFDPSALNPDDLEREMKQLGMEDGGGTEGEVPEWEKELQKELQDYEVVEENDKDNAWEKEIEDMLSSEAKE
uniref:synapse-associated protein 1-like n=1 Tax=Styela clava TaxID=7725 RepID=UPI001939D049|nr:synapse-associated protein 1-like [Styela clava]